MENQQQEALVVAEQLENGFITLGKTARELRYSAAAAIRRQHARIQELEAHITKLTTWKNEGELEIRAWDTMKEQERKIIELEKALESICAGGVFWAAGYAGRYGSLALN